MKLRQLQKRPKRREAAFTLPEILVSILITTVMVTSLYSGISQSYRMAHQTRDVARATQVMIDVTEILRLYTWEEINTPGFIPTNFVSTLDADYRRGINATNIGTRKARGVIAMKDVSFSTNYKTNMKEVTITLTWTNSNLKQTRSMTTYVARNGIQSYIYED